MHLNIPTLYIFPYTLWSFSLLSSIHSLVHCLVSFVVKTLLLFTYTFQNKTSVTNMMCVCSSTLLVIVTLLKCVNLRDKMPVTITVTESKVHLSEENRLGLVVLVNFFKLKIIY